MKKYVYFFGSNKTEGTSDIKDKLGNKGYGLAEMARLGIPIPPGFTIISDVCITYLKSKKYSNTVYRQIKENIQKLEYIIGKKLGDENNPLLISVRSGSQISMPGMMDTILNLGLNDKSVYGLAKKTNNICFAFDCYRRFISMFGNVVLNIDYYHFEEKIKELKQKKGYISDNEFVISDLKNLIIDFKNIILFQKKVMFPQNPYIQLYMAINAVFNSWNNPRAKIYRKLNNIPEDLGTAVNIQSMVYGNKSFLSATGVAFTRNPSTGNNQIYGEFLINAQGEDIVSGIRTPDPIEKLKHKMPLVYEELNTICKKLELHFKDMQDVEFTIEESKLYMLQTRTGKRTAKAAFKIAVDMVNEKIIDKKTAIMRIDPKYIENILHPSLDTNQNYDIISKGLPASPGAAIGKIVFSSDKAELLHKKGDKVILVRKETSPEDIGGMYASEGFLTTSGGMTSHAAVIGRGMGKPCIVGCNDLYVDPLNLTLSKNNKIILSEGDIITIDGGTGNIIRGEIKLVESKIDENLMRILSWCDHFKKLKILTNADNLKDIKKAIEFGAEGIGLCRTEHMFFGKDRISIVQSMILSQTKKERIYYLDKLLEIQKSDFKEIFKLMKKKIVTIRYLDPPLHEFLPNIESLYIRLNKLEKEDFEKKSVKKEIDQLCELVKKITQIKETNPMLGHRGCRLGITYPEIYNMQTKAIFEAYCELYNELKINFKLNLMIPLIDDANELRIIRQNIMKTANTILKKYNNNITYNIGAMIETPRSVLLANEISKYSDFFSFGTNDLTQMTFGFSRDDISKFFNYYLDKRIYLNDPFTILDEKGVGELLKIGIMKGRSIKKNITIGLCGEHGGDPCSISFIDTLGIDYISCSPYRIPIARLISAQSFIKKLKQ